MSHSATKSNLDSELATNVTRLITNEDLATQSKTKIDDSGYFSSHFDPNYGVNWLYLNASSPRKFTFSLVKALREEQNMIEASIREDLAQNREPRIKYQIFSSNIPGVFNLGGDLKFFLQRIKANDRKGLRQYARMCVDTVFTSLSNYKLPVTTISLVQGTAMGGGVEAALANNVIVAEKQCQMGFPEVLFNMFPGMGAYQLLCRRLNPAKAENLILSGRNYLAEDLYEMGLIDILADEGKGEEAVWEFVKMNKERTNGRNNFYSAIRNANPIDYKSFIDVADCWVEAAFNLSDSDLKTMEFLVRAQERIGC